MIARCIKKLVTDLEPADAMHFQQNAHLDEVELVIGQEYLVLGTFFREGRPWFLICESDREEYPTPYYGAMFDLVDNRVPPGWSLAVGQLNVGSVALLPESWAADPRFLERLVDGEPAAIAVLEETRKYLNNWHRAASQTE